MNKKFAITILVIFVAISMYIAPSMHSFVESSDDASTIDQLSLFSTILSYIRVGYVEEVDTQELFEGAINGMLDKLDEHTVYLTPEQFKRLNADTQGSFGGLGIEITITPEDDTLTVIAPIEGTPAYEAGVMSRDKIVEIDGESTEGIDIYDAVDKMRGKIGTDCILTIKRKGVNKLLTFTITRSLIDLPSLEYYYMLTGEIGYIRLVRFSEDTGYKMLNALNELEDEGMEGLVLDLRGNPGGLLQMAIDVSSIFLKDGENVVYTKGRYKFYDQKEYYSFGGVRVDDKIIKSEYYDLPLVILVDGSSASASEIVAGAIQDNDRGLVIGQPTFGKASVQTVIKLDEKLTDTSALKMTIAKYYTPSGNLIEKEGIKPDVEIEYPEYSPVINSIAGNGFFRVFAEDFAYNHKENSVSLFRDMSEIEFLRNLKEILTENDYEFYSEEVAKILPNEGEDFVWSEIDAEYQICRKLVERELIRLVEGNEESFRFWQKDDIWIERAINELSEIIQN